MLVNLCTEKEVGLRLSLSLSLSLPFSICLSLALSLSLSLLIYIYKIMLLVSTNAAGVTKEAVLVTMNMVAESVYGETFEIVWQSTPTAQPNSRRELVLL